MQDTEKIDLSYFILSIRNFQCTFIIFDRSSQKGFAFLQQALICQRRFDFAKCAQRDTALACQRGLLLGGFDFYLGFQPTTDIEGRDEIRPEREKITAAPNQIN